MKRSLKPLVIALAVCAAAFALVRAFTSGGLGVREQGLIISQNGGSSDWRLILVNADNPVPDGWNSELTKLANGERVDSRIYPELQQMFDDMRAGGVYPFVRAGFRSEEEQQRILDEKIQAYMQEEKSKSQARRLALDTVAKPGTSEHELGLAVDINADEARSADNEVYDWLAENAYKYGFILRYPKDKTDITGIDYEPWHYRYVGREAALDIHNSSLCLEEYLGKD